MTQQDSSLRRTESIFLVLAFGAIGAAIGLLFETNPTRQGLLGFLLGGLVGMLIGALSALLANRRKASADNAGNNEAANQTPALYPENTSSNPLSTHLTIKDVYSKENIPVQVEILVYYAAPFVPARAQQANGTSLPTSATPQDGYSDPKKREEVIRSLVTTAARRYLLTKAIEELETPETFAAMGQTIIDEVSPTLSHWPLEVQIANVEQIRLPDDVVASKVTRLIQERNAELERQIEAARVEASHKEIQVLKHIAEDSCNHAKESGIGRKERPRYVLRRLLTEMKHQAPTGDTWSACLDKLLASLDDADLGDVLAEAEVSV